MRKDYFEDTVSNLSTLYKRFFEFVQINTLRLNGTVTYLVENDTSSVRDSLKVKLLPHPQVLVHSMQLSPQ